MQRYIFCADLISRRRLTREEMSGLYSRIERLRAIFPYICDRGSYVEFFPGSVDIESKEDVSSVRCHIAASEEFLMRYASANLDMSEFLYIRYSLAALVWDFQRHTQEIVEAPYIKSLGAEHFQGQKVRIELKKYAELHVIDASTAAKLEYFYKEGLPDRLQ